MEATIAEILDNPDHYDDQVVNVDGVLVVAAFDRAGGRFDEVWIVEANTPTPRGLQSDPVSVQSALWCGLSRLTARHVPGYQGCRIHDAVRAMARVRAPENDEAPPTIELLTAAVYRQAFTLFVGAKGVRLEQALPDDVAVHGVSDIKARKSRYFGRERFVYGTLVLGGSPAAQVLLPGRIPWISATGSRMRMALAQGADDALNSAKWLADIAYPQSDSSSETIESLRDSILIDPHYAIAKQLEAFPGINQALVRPAVILGRLVENNRGRHFAAMTAISQVFLQNVRFEGDVKSFESVIKLKQFDGDAR